tara:strand:- start:495 stop:818 length:324 start_codon:yes stop_codon:yes gene_type:complete
MYQLINGVSQFRDDFAQMDRKEQFSYEALGLLYEYLEDTNPDYCLDVIELCCEYAEDTAEGIAQAYGADIEGMDEEAIEDLISDYLHDNSVLVGMTSARTFVYCSSF